MIAATVLMAALVAPQDASALLEEVRQAYSKVTTAKYQVKFETTDPHMNHLKGTADVQFLRPHSAKVVISGPNGITKTVFCNGQNLTTVTKSGRKSAPFSLETLSHLLPLNVETFAFLDWTHELSTDKGGAMFGSVISVTASVWNEQKWTVIEEVNRVDDSLDRYYIGKDDHLIWRVEDMTADGRTTFSDTRVSGMKLGEPIPESTFESSNR